MAHHFLYVSWLGGCNAGVCYRAWVLGSKLRSSLHAYVLGEHFIDRVICPVILNLLLPISLHILHFVYHWLI